MIDQTLEILIKSCSDSILFNENGFFFVQIGANDGVTNDPIHKFIKQSNWQGILVEPVPYIFEKLKETYKGNTGLHFENSAIDVKDGKRKFYRIAPNNESGTERLEKKYQEHLGSFLKSVVLEHRDAIPNFDKYLVEEEVRTLAFMSLIEKYSISKIDLLVVDAEGYDYEIIKMIPFERVSPRMILYESKNLSREDKEASKKLLIEKGYRIAESFSDTLAYQPILRHITILDLIKDYKVGVEVGTCKGELAKLILEYWPGKLYVVDAWRHIEGLLDINNPDHNGHLDNMAQTFMKLYEFGERASMIREMSVQAAQLFPDNSLDFVYVDAGHDAKSVKEDLEAWYPKVRKGGLLIGDDYFDARFHFTGVPNSETLVEVESSVNAFAESIGQKVLFTDIENQTLAGKPAREWLKQWWIKK